MNKSTKKIVGIALPLILTVGVVAVGYTLWQKYGGLLGAFSPPAQDITKLLPPEGNNSLPLNLPNGFSISVFAKDLPGARVIRQDTLGNFWVSRTKQGSVTLVQQSSTQENTSGASQQTGNVIAEDIFTDLNEPHGLAIHHDDPFTLYVAEENTISKVPIYSEGKLQKIADLPTGGRHTTRTIAFGPDDKLYVSIGSSCNVCTENNPRRGTISRMEKDGSDFEIFASGLRNAVFFDWHFLDGSMWATEMGRDHLGDNLPPDELNKIVEGGFYGWPICYGKNIHDTQFDKNTYVRAPCQERFGEIPSSVDIPAHSAPLGIAFVPEEGWPEEMWYDALIAYHGSWNRSEPTGYKIVRVPLNAHGELEDPADPIKDFITGWLQSDGTKLGRPVDLLAQPGGILYITDDSAGVIYRVVYNSDM